MAAVTLTAVIIAPSPAWAAPYDGVNLTRTERQQVQEVVEVTSRSPQSRLRRQEVNKLQRQGVLTRKQAQAVLQARTEGITITELVKQEVLTREQGGLVRAAFREATITADTAQWLAALGGLLAKGTITQTQADQIIANISEGRVTQVSLGRVIPPRIT
jgi:alkylhydroperoxidase family enzyme